MVEGISKEEYTYYFQIHRFYTKFGMPHGKGWAEEQPWLIDYLAFMDDLKMAIEAWHISNSGRPSGKDPNFML